MNKLVYKTFVLQIFVCMLYTTRKNLVSGMFMNTSCGIDKTSMNVVYEGYSRIDYYPWMGYLYYPMPDRRFTTAVVLITRQIVIATANEIAKLPKEDFRKQSKVVLGANCTAKPIGIREYTFHPEYLKSSFSEIAMIQLDNAKYSKELRPICPPPGHFVNPVEFYGMSFANDCRNSKIRIHKMNFVDLNECKHYYRRNGLNMGYLWPKYSACAKALDKVPCVWRSGTLLAMRQSGRWLLLGFGVYGPGCSEPARFVDYSMYHSWVKSSILRIGQPAITQLAPNHVVLRRSMSKLQRFGNCDPEETELEIFSDTISDTLYMSEESRGWYKKATYNLTLVQDVEYSCVVVRVIPTPDTGVTAWPPRLRLRRWCAGPRGLCHDFQLLTIDFYIEIMFTTTIKFQLQAYGQQPRAIDPQTAIKVANKWSRNYPKIYNSSKDISFRVRDSTFNWFWGWQNSAMLKDAPPL